MLSSNLPATPRSSIPKINTTPFPSAYCDRKGCIITLFLVLQMQEPTVYSFNSSSRLLFR